VRSEPCTWRRETHVSWLSLKIKVDGLSVVWPENHWDSFIWFGLKTGGNGFPNLGLKTVSSGLVIYVSKSPRQFLGLGPKTKQTLVSRLYHKTDGGRTAWDTRQDLAAYIAWKQVVLGFSSLALRLTKARLRVVHVASSWRLRREEAEDGWVDTMGCVRTFYPKIAFSNVLDPRRISVF
jgi:hypothetical protein